MTKEKFFINHEYLKILGVDPKDGVKYLESKKATTIDPIHVTVLQLLRQSPLVASSPPE